MIVKKFEAPTENEAILKAKEELGSQAVVLNSKKLVPKGLFRLFKKETYEITAALEEKEFVKEVNKKKPEFTVPPKRSGSLDILADEDINSFDFGEDIQKRNTDITSVLNTQMKKNVTQNRFSDITESHDAYTEKYSETEDNANMRALRLIYNKLIESEVDEKYANAIISEIDASLKRESDVKSILAGVYQKVILRLGEPYDLLGTDKHKVIFFIGPTGVGKTTTIAKIASKLKLTDNKKVAFITADTYRISAVEQLNTYAEIIDVDIKVVYTPEEMADAIAGFAEYDYILVDTAGRSHKNTENIDDISAYLKSADKMDNFDVETVLVLSATTKYRDLLSITDAYKFAGDYRILFTKLDETSAYGNILNVKLYTNAGLTYFTTGQNVPDDIERVNVQWLARQIIGGHE